MVHGFRVGEYVGEDDSLERFRKVMMDAGSERQSPRAKRMHSRRSLDETSHRKEAMATSPATSMSSEDQQAEVNATKMKKFGPSLEGGTNVDGHQNRSNNARVRPINAGGMMGNVVYNNSNESCNRSKRYIYNNFNANNENSKTKRESFKKKKSTSSKSNAPKDGNDAPPANTTASGGYAPASGNRPGSRDSMTSEVDGEGHTVAAGSIGTVNSIGSLADDEHSFLGSRDAASYSKNKLTADYTTPIL